MHKKCSGIKGRLIPESEFTCAQCLVCGSVSSMLSGLKTRSLGLNTLGTT